MSSNPHLPFPAGLNRKTMSRINSMPNIGFNARQQRDNQTEEAVIEGSRVSRMPLEVGSIVEVESNTGIVVYGVVRWLGVLQGKTNKWAGIELVSDLNFIHLCFQI